MTLDPRRVREHGRRILHEGSVGSFALHDIELPSGHRFTLEVIRHPGAAAVLPFLDRERIVLIRQYRFAPGLVLWEVPAGKLDPGEAPEACAARELAEETGYRAGRIERTGSILTTPGFTDERIHLFCAWDLEAGTPAREQNEWIEVRDVELGEALAMVERGEILDAKTIVALHHAARRSGHRADDAGIP
jgi:ADP-ribose pyrophosphatase